MEVEVKVTDKQGRPVLDLQPEDFTLLEDGEPQVIRTFEYVAAPGGDELVGSEGLQPKPESLDLEKPTPQDSLTHGTTWVYITGRVNDWDRKLVWRQMRKFLDENLQAGVLVSIRGGEFTSKRTELDDGLRQMIEEKGSPSSLADLNSGLDAIRFGEIEYDPQYQVRVDNLNEAFADLARQQMQYSGDFFLYQYIDLVKSLSVLPGKRSSSY